MIALNAYSEGVIANDGPDKRRIEKDRVGRPGELRQVSHDLLSGSNSANPSIPAPNLLFRWNE
jgi:hypothetical protein